VANETPRLRLDRNGKGAGAAAACPADAVTLEVFEGEHEVAGTKAIAWLASQV
jgi:hypothetical protein